MKQDIKSMTLAELQAAFAAMGEPKFRAKQVFVWLHRGATGFDAMTNLSKPLRAKLDVQLVLTGVPVLFCALCMVIVLPGSVLEKVLLVIVALLYTLLSALAALALGLKMPNLTWTNETTPIKQSGCVMLSLFANWFYALALGGLYFLCGNALSAAVYLAIFAVVTAAGSALLLHWVKQRGARIFAAL